MHLLIKWITLLFFTAPWLSPEAHITFWIFNDIIPIEMHSLSEAWKLIVIYGTYPNGRQSCIWQIAYCSNANSMESNCLSKLSDKGRAIPLPWEQNSIIHMAFQRAQWEEVVTCLWVTVAASRLNSCVSVCVCCTCGHPSPPASCYCPVLPAVWHHQGQRLQQQ